MDKAAALITPENPLQAITDAAAVHGSVAAFARSVGLAPSYVHDVLRERRPPSDKLLQAIGLERVVVKAS